MPPSQRLQIFRCNIQKNNATRHSLENRKNHDDFMWRPGKQGGQWAGARNGLDPMTGKCQCRDGLSDCNEQLFCKGNISRCKIGILPGNVKMKKGGTYHFRKHPNTLEIPTAPEPAAVVWPKRCSRSNTTMAAWNDDRAMVTVFENLPSNSHLSAENCQLNSWILF